MMDLMDLLKMRARTGMMGLLPPQAPAMGMIPQAQAQPVAAPPQPLTIQPAPVPNNMGNMGTRNEGIYPTGGSGMGGGGGGDAWTPNRGTDTRVQSGAQGQVAPPAANPNVGFSRNQNLGTTGPVIPGSLVHLLMTSRGMTEAQARATAATMAR